MADFCGEIKNHDPYLPIIIKSSHPEYEGFTAEYADAFLNSTSRTLPLDLKSILKRHCSFGDFVFTDPETGVEIARISDLQNFQRRAV